jgi:hypothetical protein
MTRTEWIPFARRCKHRACSRSREELRQGAFKGNPICIWSIVGMRCMFAKCPILRFGKVKDFGKVNN